ncbi:peptidase, M23 family [Aeromicrobium marinum DSM 15272]|uniref:Peptidase, M23 family n=1 Tax=Aeromicrobium marinum DSM 15272 TaxID=585531 RepID=E2SF47_9ACTN|nr:M23 family metallopeptidase [Aeromicrobium marinum]EFQ82132.1 peptidase, M23 family [Aeromicrobium marinum DSM 15272]
MTRRIAALRPVWDTLLALLGLLVVVDVGTAVVPGLPGLDLPGGFQLVALVVGLFIVLNLLIGFAPTADDEGPVELAAPVRGRWVAMNSPGQQLPSHGTRTRGQFGAVDVSAPSAGAPALVRWALRSSRPEEYPCFGEPVRAMAAGTVVRVRDRRRDHRARNTWQSLAFMLTFEGLLREMGGSGRVLGNHVVVDHGDGTFAAYAHLRRGSAAVAEGAQVATGDVLGRIGNTGNTSMPHLHVQLMDRAQVDAAAGIAMRWSGVDLTGEVDDQLKSFAKDPADTAVPGMPRNGEVFLA